MLIGISGKIGAGKDTVANMLREIAIKQETPLLSKEQIPEIKGFAAKLKQIVSILTGIPVEDLEKEEVKNQLLGEEWTRYGKADGFWYHSSNDPSKKLMDNVQCSKEEYEEHYRINWQTAYKQEWTPRTLLQVIGTDLFRSKINTNIWVNALFTDYKPTTWIISDVRFKNEADEIKKRGGTIIRLNRNVDQDKTIGSHISETDLDDYQFDHVIDNNGTLEELYNNLKSLNLFTNV